MNKKILLTFLALVGLAIVSVDMAVAGKNRIRIRSGGKTSDTVTIDETANPPTLTVSSGVSVRGGPGTLRDLGDGQFEILTAGTANYHVKTRGGVDSVVVYDGAGASVYWLGVGAESDSVVVYDGPGADQYKIEGKSGDDTYEIHDDTGDGNDTYYIKGASGADQFDLRDGPGDDVYKLRGRAEAQLVFTDVDGDEDVLKIKGVSQLP